MNLEKLRSRIKPINIEDYDEKYKTLNHLEKSYWDMIKVRHGVLFLTSKPGIAKSAIMREIAFRLGLEYEDFRLTQSDETDFKIPYKNDIQLDGETLTVSSYTVPEWAINANKKPTLIHFEELNRASLYVRNAALQILLERQVGGYKLNENVFMVASGNLGEEDDTEVDEFDSALNGRLIHKRHVLEVSDWLEFFAYDNIHPDIIDYIKSNPSKIYDESKNENIKAYASPRTWTMLSDFIINNFHEIKDGQFKLKPSDEYLGRLAEDGASYIGKTIQHFLRYLRDRKRVNAQDIIERFNKVEPIIEKWNEKGQRDRYSEVLEQLVNDIDYDKVGKDGIENLIGFMNLISSEERVKIMCDFIDKMTDVVTDSTEHLNFKKIIEAFPQEEKAIIE